MQTKSTFLQRFTYRIFCLILFFFSCSAFAKPLGFKGWLYLDEFPDSTFSNVRYADNPQTACEHLARYYGSHLVAMSPTLTDIKGNPTLAPSYACAKRFSQAVPVHWFDSTVLNCELGYFPRWPGMCVKSSDPDPAPPSCSPTRPGYAAGDPVIVASGENVQQELDLTVGNLQVRRTYRSRPRNLSARAGNMGWLFWFERDFKFSLHLKGSIGLVTVIMGDGSFVTFSGDSDGKGVFVRQGGSSHETLRALDPALTKWEVRTADDRIEIIQQVNGYYRLRSSHARGGAGEFYDYDDKGQLSSVSDNFGRKLQVRWEGNDVAEITGPDGSVRYSYKQRPPTGHDLIANPALLVAMSLHDSNGVELSSRHYLYDDEHYDHLLTGTIDENGKRFASFVYTAGQVSVAEHAGGAFRYTFDYPSENRRVLTDPLGTAKTVKLSSYFKHSGHRVSSFSQPAGAGCDAAANEMTYDYRGTVASRTDFNGSKTCYVNDSARQLALSRTEGLRTHESCPAGGSAVIGPNQRKTSSAWHPDWPIETRIAAPKLISTFVYNGQADSTGQVRSCAQGATLPDGKPIVVLCEKTEQETSDENGSLGFSAASIGTARVWHYSYNKDGQLLSQTAPRAANGLAGQIVHTYYADTTSTHTMGDLQSTTNAAGETIDYLEYGNHGLPTKIRHANGSTTTLSYNQRQLVTSRLVQDAQGNSQQSLYAYDNVGQLIRMQGPDGTVLDYDYDDAHRLVGMRDVLGNTTQFTLDGMGNVLRQETRNSNGDVTAQIVNTYDALGRLEQVQHGTEESGKSFEYDAAANLKAITDSLQRVQRMEYDNLSRMVQTTLPPSKPDAAGSTVDFSYNHQSQLTSVTDPRRLKTSYTVDGFGQRTQVSSPDSGVNKYRFDPASNLTSSGDARGKATDYQYDAAQRITRIAFADGSASTFEYGQAGTGAAGKLIQMRDESGQTTYNYDGFGNLLSKKQTVGSGIAARTLATSYTYGTSASSTGHVTSITYPSGNRVEFAYGPDGRPSMVTLVSPGSSGPVVLMKDIAYAPFGDVLGWHWGNSTASQPSSYVREFDLAGKVSRYTLGPPDKGGSIRVLNYDAAGRVKSMTHTGGANAASLDQHFTYDGLDRLLTVDGPGISQGFEYDDNGNRIAARFGSGSYRNAISLNSNRLDTTTGPAPAKRNLFDGAGNIVNDGTITYTYGARGRLKTASNTGIETSYSYNGLGQRVAKSGKEGAKVIYMFDEQGYLVGEYSGSGRPLSETVYLGDLPVVVLSAGQFAGPMMPPPASSTALQPPSATSWATPVPTATASPGAPQLVLTQNISNTTVSYIYADHINTPRVIARASDNAIVWRWDNADPFGLIHPQESPSGLGTFLYNIRFPGQVFDRETNNHYNYFRDYDPQTGRYIQSDPIGLDGGLNTYLYANADPLTYIDPTGEVGFVGAAVGAAVELGMQGYRNYRNGCDVFDFENYDWYDVGASAVFGAFAPGMLNVGKTFWKSGNAVKTLSSQSTNTASRAAKIANRISSHTANMKNIGATQAAFQGAKTITNSVNGDNHACGCR